MKLIWIYFLICFCLLWSWDVQAGELAKKLENFSQWQKLTSVQSVTGDLAYPEWMLGDWLVTSTLVDLAAPLAPDIITPGFEGNRQYLNQPISFKVKFIPEKLLISGSKLIPRTVSLQKNIVADRAFNGLSLARAYLGDDLVLAVKVDPESPNRQITLLRGDRQLVSVVTARTVEKTKDSRYITAEVFQQLFKGGQNPYFNQVESTTAYQQQLTSHPQIIADQVTAVYLSPQDPKYFQAGSRPVALYRYHLEFSR